MNLKSSFSRGYSWLENRRLLCQGLGLTLLLAASPLLATVYYVSGSGNDSNSGLTNNSPFLTIQKAVDKVTQSDTVYVMDGIYSNSDYNSGSPSNWVAMVKSSGMPAAPITIQNYPGATPKLVFNGQGGFLVFGHSYIAIKGFTITGNNDQCTLSKA